MHTDSGTTLMVASTGGHLTELHALGRRFADQLGPIEWATFRSHQTHELLGDQVVHHIEPVLPRDLRGAVLNLPLARRLFEERGITRVISTGAGVAVPFMLTARQLGLPAHYIESAARVDRPSLTGSMMARIPGVHLYTQHAWDDPQWVSHGSVFDGFLSVTGAPARQIRSVVVTFGTQRGYNFRRAVARLVDVLPTLAPTPPTVLWQTGATDTFGLGIDSRPHIPFSELGQAIGEADLVISHSGVGSALMALTHGKVPVLVPRRLAHGEHADDHQVQIARHLEARGLGIHVEADELDAETLLAATGRSAVAARPATFDLRAEGILPRRAARRTARIALSGIPRQRRPEPVAPAAALPAPGTRASRISIPAQRSAGAPHLRVVADLVDADDVTEAYGPTDRSAGSYL